MQNFLGQTRCIMGMWKWRMGKESEFEKVRLAVNIYIFLAHLYWYLPTCNLPHGGLVRPCVG